MFAHYAIKKIPGINELVKDVVKDVEHHFMHIPIMFLLISSMLVIIGNLKIYNAYVIPDRSLVQTQYYPQVGLDEGNLGNGQAILSAGVTMGYISFALLIFFSLYENYPEASKSEKSGEGGARSADMLVPAAALNARR